MKFITVILTCALVGSVYSIHNGQTVEPNSIPFMVKLHMEDGGHKASRCGGALVKVDRVLTAGHCLKGKKGGRATVGAHRIHDEDEETRQTISFDEDAQYPHPSFSKGNGHDVGMIKLPESFKLNEYVALIKLPYGFESNTFAGDIGKIAGWGEINDGEQNNGALRAVENPILSNEECKKHSGHIAVDSGNICLSAKNGKRTCSGDSGSPLTVNIKGDIYVVGVVSKGAAKCDDKAPSVFTRITSYLDPFIKDNMSG